MSQNNINFIYDTTGNRVSRTTAFGATQTAMNGDGNKNFLLKKCEDFFTEGLAKK